MCEDFSMPCVREEPERWNSESIRRYVNDSISIARVLILILSSPMDCCTGKCHISRIFRKLHFVALFV